MQFLLQAHQAELQLVLNEKGRGETLEEVVQRRQASGDSGAPVADFLLDVQTSVPLLCAYTDRVEELETELRRAHEDLARFQSEVDRLRSENAQLRAQVAGDVEARLRGAADGSLPGPVPTTSAGATQLLHGLGFALPPPSSSSSSFPSSSPALSLLPPSSSSSSMMAMMDPGAVLAAGEADELVERLGLQARELDVLREEVATRAQSEVELRSALQRQEEALGQAQEAVRSLDAQVQELVRQEGQRAAERDAAEAQVRAQVSRAESLLRESEKLAAELRRGREDAAGARQDADDFRAALEELQSKATEEMERMAGRLRLASDRARELRAQLDVQERENEAAREERRALQEALGTAKKDCMGMLQVVQGRERQLAELEAREARAAAVERDATEKMEAAVLERDAAQAREQQARREIARLVEKARSAAAEALRRGDDSLSATRERLSAAVAERDAEIEQLRTELVTLRAAAERAQKDRSSAELELQALRQAAEHTMAQLNDRHRLEGEARREAETHQLDEARRRAAADTALRALESELDAERARLGGRVKVLEATVERLRAAHATADADARRAGDRATEATEALDALRARSRDEIDQLRSDVAVARSQREKEKQTYEERVAGLQERVHRAEERAEEATSTLQRVELRIRDEVKTTLAHYEATTRQLKEENTRLQMRVQQLSTQLSSLVAEHAIVEGVAEEAEEGLVGIRTALTRTRREADTMGHRVSELLQKEEEYVRELSRARGELDKAQLNLSRAEQRRDEAESRAREVTQAVRGRERLGRD